MSIIPPKHESKALVGVAIVLGAQIPVTIQAIQRTLSLGYACKLLSYSPSFFFRGVLLLTASLYNVTMLPLRIVVRTNTPWETMTADSFVRQTEPEKPSEFIRVGAKLLPVWERATGLSYFQYRARLRDICQSKLQELRIPMTVGLQGIDWDGPDEALLPIDDDDIFYPNVSSIGEWFRDGINLVTWCRVTCCHGRTAPENPEFGGQLDTNNWAIRKSFLRKWPLSERNFALARHWQAAGVLQSKLGGAPQMAAMSLADRAKKSVRTNTAGIKLKHPSIVELKDSYGCYYVHSGSISFLVYKIGATSDPEGFIKSLPLHPLWEVPCIS